MDRVPITDDGQGKQEKGDDKQASGLSRIGRVPLLLVRVVLALGGHAGYCNSSGLSGMLGTISTTENTKSPGMDTTIGLRDTSCPSWFCQLAFPTASRPS